MTDYYVDNSIEDAQGYFTHIVATFETCNLANGNEITNISGSPSMSDGDIIQLDYDGSFHAHRMEHTGSPPWRVSPNHNKTGTFDTNYGHKAGTAKTTPFVGINRAAVEADENDTVWVRKPSGYGTLSYKLDGLNQVPENIPGVDCGEGTIIKNTQVKFRGFHTNIHDMARGGDYYQHIWDAWRFGVNLDCYLEVDGANANWNLLYFNTTYDTSIVFENFYFHNVNQAQLLIHGVSTMNGLVFRHCIFDDANTVLQATCSNVLFIDCLFKNNFAFGNFNLIYFAGESNYIVNSIIDMPEFGGTPNKCALRYTSANNGGCIGSIVRGGAYPILSGVNVFVLLDSIVYDGLRGFAISNSLCTAFVYNNIFCPHDHEDVNASCIGFLGGGGAVIYNDYNCFWSADGQQMGVGKVFTTGYGGGSVSVIGANSIEADPLFRDPTNHDFSLDWKSPVIDMGFRNGFGFSSMGATKRKIKRPFIHTNKGVM